MASKTIFSALSNDKRKSYEALKNCLLLVMQKIAGIRIGLLPQLQQSAGIWDAASWLTAGAYWAFSLVLQVQHFFLVY